VLLEMRHVAFQAQSLQLAMGGNEQSFPPGVFIASRDLIPTKRFSTRSTRPIGVPCANFVEQFDQRHGVKLHPVTETGIPLLKPIFPALHFRRLLPASE